MVRETLGSLAVDRGPLPVDQRPGLDPKKDKKDKKRKKDKKGPRPPGPQVVKSINRVPRTSFGRSLVNTGCSLKVDKVSEEHRTADRLGEGLS